MLCCPNHFLRMILSLHWSGLLSMRRQYSFCLHKPIKITLSSIELCIEITPLVSETIKCTLLSFGITKSQSENVTLLYVFIIPKPPVKDNVSVLSFQVSVGATITPLVLPCNKGSVLKLSCRYCGYFVANISFNCSVVISSSVASGVTLTKERSAASSLKMFFT